MQPGMKKLVLRFGILAVLLGMLFVTPLAADGGYGPPDCRDHCLEQLEVCLHFCKSTFGGLLCQLQCTADKLVCQVLCEV